MEHLPQNAVTLAAYLAGIATILVFQAIQPETNVVVPGAANILARPPVTADQATSQPSLTPQPSTRSRLLVQPTAGTSLHGRREPLEAHVLPRRMRIHGRRSEMPVIRNCRLQLGNVSSAICNLQLHCISEYQTLTDGPAAPRSLHVTFATFATSATLATSPKKPKATVNLQQKNKP